ncbi:hypothetical protein RHSIM_Rhsim04G0151100 [Rhododendron simsii]|uniref:DUF8040 domain-containing protein n=1 Tax=Rhododendron simsii TaxID=118357 RepID=A0A834LS67_RHOSS|nr:hypothetical protein RHSIM_Rhsim04G0151100 [Rhododendron simsii]
MDPASGSYFGNNENTGANNLFGIFGDGTNYNYRDLYNNVNYVHATNSSDTILEIWSRAGSGAPLGSMSNASLFRNEETENGSRYGGTGHGSSSNQCGGFQNEGIEDGGEYGASETEEEDPLKTDESLLLEDEDDVPEHVAHAVYQKDVQYLEMLKNHALEYVPVEIVRIPYHMSTHNGFDWVMSVLTCPNPRRCPENFSMTSEVFVKLCEELVYKYGFHTIRRLAIGIFESLAMF